MQDLTDRVLRLEIELSVIGCIAGAVGLVLAIIFRISWANLRDRITELLEKALIGSAEKRAKIAADSAEGIVVDLTILLSKAKGEYRELHAITSELHQSNPIEARAAVSDRSVSAISAKIHYGDPVVFRHFTTGRFLSSLSGQVFSRAQGGSGQQMTFCSVLPDENSIWIFRSDFGRPETDRVGQEIGESDMVRIFHQATSQYLHSHSTPGPSSRSEHPQNQQREVTVATGNNVQDNWLVAQKIPCLLGMKWRFKHSDGHWFLHSHTRELAIAGRSGCSEVTCCSDRNDDDLWFIESANDVRSF